MKASARIALLICVLLCIMFFLSPYWSISGLVSAAADGDTADLSERVDFPALRESLKAQFMSEAIKTRSEMTGWEGLGVSLGMLMADKLIENMVSPAGLVTLFKPHVEELDTNRVQIASRLLWSNLIHWDGLSRVCFSSENQRFCFRRSWLAWRLTSMLANEKQPRSEH